jgi:choline dehydrogenase-like flavoprotein
MVYFRGSKRDFDQWEHDFGLGGWGYNDVLPFFKKYENNQDTSDTKVHGHSGPINISMYGKTCGFFRE